MIRIIPYLRRMVQLCSVLFLIYLIISTAFPLEIKIPVELYLRIDPFIALSAIVAAKEVVMKMLPAFLMLFLVALLGNFFCGWLCPMGAVIDLWDRLLTLLGARVKKFDDSRLRTLRYGILLFALAAALLNWQIMALLDPISLITRTMVAVFYPGAVFIVNHLLPLLQKILPGLSMLDSAIPMPSFKSTIPVLLTFIIILGLSFMTRRFWCRYLCPLGALYSIASHLRIFKRSVADSCTSCGKCARQCAVGAIPLKETALYDQHRCINCFTCIECPPGAATFNFSTQVAVTVKGVSLSRRYVISSLAFGVLSSLAVRATAALPGQGAAGSRLIRPPGSLPERVFTAACTGCGECMKVCPNKALQPSLMEAGLAGLYTPRLVPRIGYCEEFCNFCGQVCPTGAIRSISLEEKRLIKLGVARVDRSRCIAWAQGKICLACNEQCSYHAVIGDDNKCPVVIEEKCTGCGICENKCPVKGESAIVVYSRGEQKRKSGNNLHVFPNEPV
jgi:ferredoxin